MADDMGLFRTDVEVASHARRDNRRLLKEVLVDTGAEYSWIPATVLDALGVAHEKRRRFRQADGSILERPIGFVLLKAAGVETTDEVVFGEPNDMVLLGAHTLEGMNLRIDLVRKQLVDAGPIIVAHAA